MRDDRGTARDPDLDEPTVRLRYEVLLLLRGLGRDARGTGPAVPSTDLARHLTEHVEGLSPTAGEVGQVGRWFARVRDGDAPEWVAYWVNGSPPRFGLRRDRTNEEVDRVLATYARRLAAYALAREPEPEPEPEVGEAVRAARGIAPGDPWADPDFSDAVLRAPLARQREVGLVHQNMEDDRPAEVVLEQFRGKTPDDRESDERVRERIARVGRSVTDAANEGAVREGIVREYDVRAVEEFERVFREFLDDRPRSDALRAISALIAVAPGEAPRSAPGTVVRAFEGLTPWERANALHRIAPLAERLVAERARDWAEVARAAESGGKR